MVLAAADRIALGETSKGEQRSVYRSDANDSADLAELKRFLLRVSRTSRLSRAITIVAPVLLAAMLVMAVAMIIDARFPMNAIARLCISAACACVTLWSAWRLLAIVLPCSTEVHVQRLSQSARLCEQRIGIEDSRLINSVRLSIDAPTESAGTIARVGELAYEGIQGTRSSQIVDWRHASRAGAVLCALVAVLLTADITQPRLAEQVCPRFLAPLADNPPFTWTDFAFSIVPEEITIGDDAHIRVDLGGQLPEELRLVMTDIAGHRLGSVTMAPETQGSDPETRSFGVTLRSLHEPVRFFAEGTTGRSRGVVISPVARPRLIAGTLLSEDGAIEAILTDADAVNVFGVQAGTLVEIQAEYSIPPSRVLITNAEGGSEADDVEVRTDGATAFVRVRIEGAESRSLSLRGFGATGLSARDDLQLTLRSIEFGEKAGAIPGEVHSGTPMRMLGNLDLKGRAIAFADGGPSDSTSTDPGANAETNKSNYSAELEFANRHDDAASEASGVGQGGVGSIGSTGQTPRRAIARAEDRSADISESEGARIAGPPEPTFLERSGLGDQNVPGATSEGAMMAGVPEAYRDMVGRYFRLIDERSRAKPEQREEPR